MTDFSRKRRDNGRIATPKNGSMLPVEKVAESDRSVLAELRAKVDALRRRQYELQRELTLASADLYRLQDALDAKGREVTEKYKLQKGARELNVATGEIVAFSGKRA